MNTISWVIFKIVFLNKENKNMEKIFFLKKEITILRKQIFLEFLKINII